MQGFKQFLKIVANIGVSHLSKYSAWWDEDTNDLNPNANDKTAQLLEMETER